MIIESIKEGFRITHKNWQIILLKIAVGIINLVGFFLFVGIPIAIGIFSLGMDVAQAKDILPGILNNPAEILSKYLRLAILIFITSIIYLTAASVLILYVFGGTLGVLRNAAINEQYRFGFSSFFGEAKKVFFPLLWLFSIALLVIIGILTVFGVLAGILISMIRVYSDTVTAYSIFATYFFGLLGITFVLAGIIFTAYAAIVLVVENSKVMASFKNTWNFMKNKPMAFVFYIILFIGIIAANFVLIALGVSFSTAPVVSYLFIIPYRLISYVVQSYLGVVMWGALLVFYIKGINFPVCTNTATTYDI